MSLRSKNYYRRVNMAEINMKIDGMSCQHCVMSVKKAVDAVEGINSSEVSVGSAKILYDDIKTDRDAFVKAVQDAGYKVIG
jgi:copper chaperone